MPRTRGLRSSNSQLNQSRFCRRNTLKSQSYPATKSYHVKPKSVQVRAPAVYVNVMESTPPSVVLCSPTMRWSWRSRRCMASGV